MIDGDLFYIKSEYVYCQLESTAQMSLQSSSEERESVLVSADQLLSQASSSARLSHQSVSHKCQTKVHD